MASGAKPTKRSTETVGRGRPPGSKNVDAEIVDAELTRCPKCSSTERSAYFGKTEQEFSGVDGSGNPYTHIVRRRTNCAQCGQQRIDRTFENRSDEDQ